MPRHRLISAYRMREKKWFKNTYVRGLKISKRYRQPHSLLRRFVTLSMKILDANSKEKVDDELQKIIKKTDVTTA